MTDQPARQADVPARGVEGELHRDRQLGGRDLTHWATPPGRWLAGLVERVGVALGARQTLVLILAVGATVAATMSWLASETYEAVTESEGVALWDQPLLDTMLTLRSPGLDTFVTGFTNVGGVIGMPVLALSLTAFLTVRRQSWTPVLLVAAAATGSLLMTIVGKNLIGRSRPPLSSAVPPFEHTASFPSGHSLNALVVAGVIAYLVVLRQKSARARVLTVSVAALFAFAMGMSRVFLGHHWFTDVLAAWVLGLGWLTVVITAHRLYLTTRLRTRETIVDAS
ncbi:phosphatase PAP2 family protein [Ornithinimicrobium cryptoxanthini]|uniref:Phosphatase PAP2 family protein n=1 Tax=Ornithinimicrobium cryptoxanthini TaxID=2934161 RepID=A0ABY4YDM1_9MICO|nr:phosphatase PAP2 family protein [Ornithinimicrobium cryptoxanthini]USQ74842.1 phosphatase PAP2 family protein [Ornithinimicrobium cryptoxanthini]